MRVLVGPSADSGLPASSRRADDGGCPKGAEEGNVVSMRHKAYAPIAGTRDRCLRSGDASFTRSSGPCTSILTTHWAQVTVVRRSKGITVGQTRVTENNQHWGSCTGRSAARLALLSSAKARAWRAQKRKGVEASVPARIKSSGLVARTSIVVAEVGRRQRVSNKLGKRAPKRAVRVE